MHQSIKGFLVAWLSALLAFAPITGSAGMVGTDQMMGAAKVEADRESVRAFLDRENVQEHLLAWGVASDDAIDRVARLSDAEVATLAEEIETAPAGSGALAVLGVVFIVLIVLELVGVTNVFSKI